MSVSAGGSKDWERSHQPEGCRTGWLGGPVQNQTAHTPQQTNEGILWTTGNPGASTLHFNFAPFAIMYNYCKITALPHSASFLLDANCTSLCAGNVPDTWLHFNVCCVTSCRALRYGRSGSGSMASLLMRRIHLHRYGTMVRLHLYFLKLSLR